MFLLPDMRDAMGYVMEESFPGAGRLAEAVERYPGSEEKNHTAWNIGHSTELPIFEFLEHHPARMQRFLGSMRMLGGGEGFELTHMLAGFDWRGLGPGLVVDVGGSAGHCSDAIAEIAPELRFVAQDLEKVVEAAKEERKNENKENPRISFKAHDFFTPQPIQNADVYLLRFICHDYSDKYAAKILASITPAMGPNSRIVVVESIVPPAGSLGRFDERRMR
jgi:6-hydroxytryprostatin B O-methyltransferase